MDLMIEDLLYEWALYHFPRVLEDQELFEGFVRFVDALLTAAVWRERSDAFRRILTPSMS